MSRRRHTVLRPLAVLLGAGLSLASCSGSSGTGGGPVIVTVYGEDVALTGFAFPSDTGFRDGWEVRFDRLLVTIGEITLSDNPDKSPTDESQTDGVLAAASGPFAVDLSKEGRRVAPGALTAAALRTSDDQGDVVGRGGTDDHSIRLVRIDDENRNGGRAFSLDRRYAFGFRFVAASAAAKRMNFDAAADAAYAEMIRSGFSVYYEGTATFRGGKNCVQSAPYDFGKLPGVVRFKFGFATPTRYVNCQNSDLTGAPFAGEEKQRGIQLGTNGPTYVQISLHTDHPFWDRTDHDGAEPYFDQMAALAKNGELTLDDLALADPTAFRDRAGAPLPWRSCMPGVTADAVERRGAVRSFDISPLRVDRRGEPSLVLRNYEDLATYLQSTQGHLNADGLCFAKRDFPAPR